MMKPFNKQQLKKEILKIKFNEKYIPTDFQASRSRETDRMKNVKKIKKVFLKK